MSARTAEQAPVLPDQAARDVITGELERTLFVEAGAGSGKTSSLVDRIVNMVEQGRVPVEKIAAITFTEAAARELRTRVRDAMIAGGLRSAGEVESAAFTTLHGFALRILSDHAIEAGLPPGFGVVDEITSALEFERDWRLFVGHVGDDLGLLELQERAAALSIKLDSFSTVARSFDDNWDLLESFDELVEARLEPLSDLDTSEMLARVVELADFTPLCISDDDKMCAAILGVVGEARSLLRAEPLVQLRGLLSLKLPGRVGRKDSGREPGVDHVRSRIAELAADIDA
ncbi:MAG: UvrD-helicase domain-containing protein, partial [Acidimicrobiia bacterium]|nr:UvrD-helicase domain-containing protein [Acidimicrobiia bacterium]